MPNGEKLDSMETEQVKFELVRVVAVVAVFVFMAVLLYYLPSSGYSESRLVFFGVLARAALLGAVGVIVRNIAAIAVGCSVLFLLGFWRVAFGVFILPAAGVLVIAAYSEAMRQKE